MNRTEVVGRYGSMLAAMRAALAAERASGVVHTAVACAATGAFLTLAHVPHD